MATQTEIVNRALRKLGANKLVTTIASTTDKNAIIMSDMYTQSLEAILAETFWTFAVKRVELDLATSGESNEWEKYDLNFIYDLPTDLIRIVGWSDGTAVVRREGEYFLSDSSGGTSTISVQEDGVDDWVTATVYAIGDFVANEDAIYYCSAAHTSGATTEPSVGADWEDYWQLMSEDVKGVWITEITNNLGIIYIYLNDTEATYPSYFVEAFSDKLALDTSYAIVQSGPKTESLEARYKSSLRIAKTIDSQGQTPQTPIADAWVNAKYNGNALQGRRNLNYRS